MVKAPKVLDKKALNEIDTPARDSDLKGLDWDELKWLQDRGKLSKAQQVKHGFTPNAGVGGSYPPGEEPARTMYAEEEEFGEGDDDLGYTSWSKSQLQEEIDNRNEMREDEDQLRRTGSKSQLVAVLENDDEETDEE